MSPRRFVKLLLKPILLRLPILFRFWTGLNLWRNRRKASRKLEIGPGPRRIEGFETLDVVPRRHVDYVADAAKPLPFKDNTFSLIYASHILEHIPWYQAEDVLQEWVRVIKPGGHLEVWVPDGLKICKALVDYELEGRNYIDKDGWYRFNPEKEPCKWASGRIYTYGDGTGETCHPNWHRSLFTPRYLRKIMENAGMHEVREMDRSEVRGDDHGWINMGLVGTKHA